tara:strand:- start:71569 stop:71760 length:192 start_codon:yes stop_codon:yes gene_type:complete
MTAILTKTRVMLELEKISPEYRIESAVIDGDTVHASISTYNVHGRSFYNVELVGFSGLMKTKS